MHVAVANEFAFVALLPKREKGRVSRALDLVEELTRITEEQGPMIPSPLAAKVLNISRQRMHQLIQDKRIPVVEVQGHHFVTKTALIGFANTERKDGRPISPPTRFTEQVKLAWDYAHSK